MKTVFTTGEAAKICKVSQQTIIRCFDSGQLKGFRVPGSRFRRIPRDQLFAFMKDNGIPTDALESGKRKVLLVDDDAELVELITDVLDKDGRFEVRIANNGFDAGMLVKEYGPDLIVLDVMLPDINGKEVCQRVRKDHAAEEVKIICISGMVEEDKIADLKAAGANDFLHKPFEVDTLIERMCRMLDIETATTRERRAKMATYDDAELLRAKLEALAEFAAGAGHEINNPLAVISGRAQLLLRDERDPERRRELGIIRAQALRIHEMIADLMLFARPPAPEPTACDLSQVVEAALAGLRSKAELLQVRLERVGRTEPLTATVDGEQILVALRAVIDNGLNALRPGGRVSVELRSSQNAAAGGGEEVQAVELVVRDDGPGIPAAVREHLFDPFFSGREAGRGLGMGLPKAWRIVTNHGGTITLETNTVEPTAGPGAVFVLRLPLVPAPLAGEDAAARSGG